MIEAPSPPGEMQGRKFLWRVADHLDRELAGQLPVSHMISHLLYQRGYRTAGAITAFLQDPSPDHDPYLMPDMAPAVERITRAAHAGEPVAVYGDFDSDGLTASAIFLDSLRHMGLEPTIVIPTRNEGHGLRPNRIEELRAEGTSLVITADCGITDLKRSAWRETSAWTSLSPTTISHLAMAAYLAPWSSAPPGWTAGIRGNSSPAQASPTKSLRPF